VIMKLCQNSVQILLKPAGMGYFPRTSFARQNYEMMITKTVMSLTFRNEDNRNSLWLCRYFGLNWTVNTLPNVPEFTGSADYK